MFCPNCGKDCADANFCMNCGTNLQEEELLEIPVGVYSGYKSRIELGQDWIEIFNNGRTTRIPYDKLTAVYYKRQEGLHTGFVTVRYEDNKDLSVPKDFGGVQRDNTSIHSTPNKDIIFYHICCFLYTFLDHTDVPAPAHARKGVDGDVSSMADLSTYYDRFNPNRINAANALSKDTGISKTEAENRIDIYFDSRQREEYAANPAAALRDLNKILNKPQEKRRRQLEEANQAFCPRCLSTSITAKRRGYNITQALLLRGVQYGMLGMNRVQCICMKCGHTWTPSNK